LYDLIRLPVIDNLPESQSFITIPSIQSYSGDVDVDGDGD